MFVISSSASCKCPVFGDPFFSMVTDKALLNKKHIADPDSM